MAKFNVSSPVWDGAIPQAMPTKFDHVDTAGVNWNGRTSVMSADLARGMCHQVSMTKAIYTEQSVIVWQRGWELGSRRNELGTFVPAQCIVDRRIEYARDGSRKNVTYFHHAWR